MDYSHEVHVPVVQEANVDLASNIKCDRGYLDDVFVAISKETGPQSVCNLLDLLEIVLLLRL